MAIVPCLFGYVYIFCILVETNCKWYWKIKYIDIIHDYSLDEYVKTCEDFSKFAEEKCKDCSEERKKRIK